MNTVQLIGRFTKDPDIRCSDSGTLIARFTLAVDRRFKSENGPSADFINCVAFGKTGEFIERYFSKGNRIGLTGRIQTGSYTNKDNVKVYTADVVAESVEFVERKSSEASPEGSYRADSGGLGQTGDDGFIDVPDGMDEELPFA